MRRRLVVLAVTVSALAGCGFQLRRPPELQLKRVFLAGFDAYSPMGDELRRQLRASPGVVLTETAAEADVVLEVLEDAREQVVAASTATGQVRELTLRARLRFKARTPAGAERIAPTELMLTRDVSYSETTALAKEQEIALLFRSMHTDLAAQVLRRLAALTPG
ncbi:LPS assembly lipoprotein LptE [Sphaerotilus sp.]|uniref:LPS-assembly lipoprotein LptE n=1 Tax=Sphaerotilus sp. TaxID=2093942 RepID=UPI002ACE455D|nr:LPS assembly lipoprotein LptE [Sphaerotilus sp.]MDZ7858858.1 LPS assembly lipoprotein LptE [Sphaerotilus sp.]